MCGMDFLYHSMQAPIALAYYGLYSTRRLGRVGAHNAIDFYVGIFFHPPKKLNL